MCIRSVGYEGHFLPILLEPEPQYERHSQFQVNPSDIPYGLIGSTHVIPYELQYDINPTCITSCQFCVEIACHVMFVHTPRLHTSFERLAQNLRGAHNCPILYSV